MQRADREVEQRIGGYVADLPLGMDEVEVQRQIDSIDDRIRENSKSIRNGVISGALAAGQIIGGLLIALVVLFFFVKDGERMWGYLLSFTGKRSRAHADEVGTRVYGALAGYVRGIALVGLVDAVLIGLALLIIGVPLVIPIMVITFFAAFIPLIGAFVAGLGTSGTFMGTGRRLRAVKPSVRLISVQPDSPFHGLEGLKHMASAIVPGIYDPTLADDDLRVGTEDAWIMMQRVAREEGILAGVSGGAALVAARQIAAELDEGVVVVFEPPLIDGFAGAA